MAALLAVFANNLLPILLIAACGFALGRTTQVEPRTIGRVTFNIFSPVLIFRLLTDNRLEIGRLAQMLGFTSAVFFLMGGLAYLTGRLLKLPRPILTAVVLTVAISNNGNYGLPLIAFAFGEEAMAYASLYYIAIAVLTNTVGVLWASLGRMTLKQALLGLLKVPMLYAVGIALLFIRTGWVIPAPLDRTIGLLAGAAVPSMLILLGLELSRFAWSKHISAIAVSLALRLLAGPLVGGRLAPLFGLEGAARQAGVTQTAMPTAVITTVLASEYNLEPHLVTAIVFFSTILSPLTLTPLLFLLGG
ncbi:MAG: AEC family transporter [Anaerolineales bacterium]